MFNLKIESYLKLIFAISLISLISAYFIEYFLGHQPCTLCLLERIPYALSIILIVISHLLNKNQKFLGLSGKRHGKIVVKVIAVGILSNT